MPDSQKAWIREFQKSEGGYVDQLDVQFALLFERDRLGNHLVDDHLRRLFGCVPHRHRVRSQQIHHDVHGHLLLHALQHAEKLDLVVCHQAVAALALDQRAAVAQHRHQTRLDVLQKLVFRPNYEENAQENTPRACGAP